jgi:Immunoglobulin-like domain of bacterial spore germination
VTLRLALALILGIGLVSGCGGNDDEQATVRVYLLGDGKVWPVVREVANTEDLAADAVEELRMGPTDREAEEGFVSAVPAANDAKLSRLALAQLVYTQSQLSTADPVEVDGKRYTRADFEAETPQILVESPLPFEEVTTPLRVTGTANTFEATFDYELRDSAGKVVDSNFVTATSGTGTRGTFDFTTKAVDDVASLVVFERSAKDGSRVNEVEIPLRTR